MTPAGRRELIRLTIEEGRQKLGSERALELKEWLARARDNQLAHLAHVLCVELIYPELEAVSLWNLPRSSAADLRLFRAQVFGKSRHSNPPRGRCTTTPPGPGS